MTVTAEQLTQALDRIYNGGVYESDNFGDIWSSLPDVASGPKWVKGVMDAADSIKGYLTPFEEYELDDLGDYAGEYADSSCIYYKAIHDQVHDLDLWASDDITQDVSDMVGENCPSSLTAWESLYLYSAMAITWRVVLEQAFTFAEEMSEETVSA